MLEWGSKHKNDLKITSNRFNPFAKIPNGPVGKNPNLWEILAKDNIDGLDGKIKNADPITTVLS